MSTANKIEIPLIKATNENLRGYGYLVDDFDKCEIEIIKLVLSGDLQFLWSGRLLSPSANLGLFKHKNQKFSLIKFISFILSILKLFLTNILLVLTKLLNTIVSLVKILLVSELDIISKAFLVGGLSMGIL